jgi:hypothetical protein
MVIWSEEDLTETIDKEEMPNACHETILSQAMLNRTENRQITSKGQEN